MQGLAGSDWHRLIPAVAKCEFRNKNLNLFPGSGQATLTNGMSVMTGKLGQGIYLGGQQYQTTNKANYLSFSRGTQISGLNYTNFNSHQGSISFHMKPYWDSSDGKNHYIIGNSGSAVLLYQSSAGNLIFTINGVNAISSASSFVAGAWYHIVLRWDCDTIVATSKYAQCYINGAEFSSYTSTMSASLAGATFYLGCDASFNNPAEIILDDFAIWDRVLSDAEIADLYNSGTGRVASTYADSHLKLYLPFDASAAYSGTALGCSAGNMWTGNLVTDGTMEAVGTSGYTVLVGGSISKNTASEDVLFDTQSLNVIGVSSADGVKTADITTVSGTSYHIEFWYKKTTGNPYLQIGYSGSSSNYVGVALDNTSGWHFYETEIKADNTVLNIYFTQSGASALDLDVDGLVVVASKVTNGGMESWSSATDADNWTESLAGTSTINQDTDEHTGTYACRMDIDGSSNLVQLGQTVSSSGWTMICGYAKTTTDAAIGFMPASTQTTFSLTTSYARLAMITTLSFSAFYIKRANGTNQSIWIDDVFMWQMSSIDITLTYLSESDLYEVNADEKMGITLKNQYITFPWPSGIEAQGSLLFVFTPIGIYNEEDTRYLLIHNGSQNIRIYELNGIISVKFGSATTINLSTVYSSNSLWQQRFRFIISWDFTNGEFLVFLNGAKVASLYESVSTPSYDSSLYIGRINSYLRQTMIHVEKLVVFNKPIKQYQAIGIDNAYEYAI